MTSAIYRLRYILPALYTKNEMEQKIYYLVYVILSASDVFIKRRHKYKKKGHACMKSPITDNTVCLRTVGYCAHKVPHTRTCTVIR